MLEIYILLGASLQKPTLSHRYMVTRTPRDLWNVASFINAMFGYRESASIRWTHILFRLYLCRIPLLLFSIASENLTTLSIISWLRFLLITQPRTLSLFIYEEKSINKIVNVWLYRCPRIAGQCGFSVVFNGFSAKSNVERILNCFLLSLSIYALPSSQCPKSAVIYMAQQLRLFTIVMGAERSITSDEIMIMYIWLNIGKHASSKSFTQPMVKI